MSERQTISRTVFFLNQYRRTPFPSAISRMERSGRVFGFALAILSIGCDGRLNVTGKVLMSTAGAIQGPTIEKLGEKEFATLTKTATESYLPGAKIEMRVATNRRDVENPERRRNLYCHRSVVKSDGSFKDAATVSPYQKVFYIHFNITHPSSTEIDRIITCNRTELTRLKVILTKIP